MSRFIFSHHAADRMQERYDDVDLDAICEKLEDPHSYRICRVNVDGTEVIEVLHNATKIHCVVNFNNYSVITVLPETMIPGEIENKLTDERRKVANRCRDLMQVDDFLQNIFLENNRNIDKLDEKSKYFRGVVEDLKSENFFKAFLLFLRVRKKKQTICINHQWTPYRIFHRMNNVPYKISACTICGVKKYE